MVSDVARLLPPNASPLERALEQATARVGAVTSPILDLWDPASCPADLLPWLAWALSVDQWDSSWTEAQKRAAVAASIDLHRHKGTRYTVEAVLASFDALLEVVEWWQTSPRGDPHTFDIVLPMDGSGGARATAAFAEAIIREVSRVKPARSHLRLVQKLEAEGLIGIVGAARVVEFRRDDAGIAPAQPLPWDSFLQTEDGEPLQDFDGTFLEDGI